MARRAHALVTLGLAQQDWGPAYADLFSHAEFSAGWRGAEPCPTEAEIDAAAAGYSATRENALQAIFSIEKANPFTHRALREFFIAFGELYPAAKATPLYLKSKAADDAIKIERAKL